MARTTSLRALTPSPHSSLLEPDRSSSSSRQTPRTRLQGLDHATPILASCSTRAPRTFVSTTPRSVSARSSTTARFTIQVESRHPRARGLRCPLEYSQDPERLNEDVMLSDDLVERDHQRLEPVVTHDRELPIPEVALPEERMSSMFAGARLQPFGSGEAGMTSHGYTARLQRRTIACATWRRVAEERARGTRRITSCASRSVNATAPRVRRPGIPNARGFGGPSSRTSSSGRDRGTRRGGRPSSSVRRRLSR